MILLEVLVLLALLTQCVSLGGQSVGRPSDSRSVDVVMIVDDSSALAAMTAIHSIVSNAKRDTLSRLRINIVINAGASADDASEFMQKWESSIACFKEGNSHAVFDTAEFRLPSHVEDVCRDHSHICARFYVPSLFPGLHRYIYLDNDVLVTCDIIELWVEKIVRLHDFVEQPSVPRVEQPLRTKHIHFPEVRSGRGAGIDPATLQRVFDRRIPKPKSGGGGGGHRYLASSSAGTPAISFVWENHPMYKGYLEGNFNISHPLVSSIQENRGKKLFFNAGVAVVNVHSWNHNNITGKFEELVRENEKSYVFNFKQAGDQAVFYLLDDESEIGAIPQARFNMRRLPKKTIQLVSSGTKGIIHWAGTTGVHVQTLCDEPMKYPLLHETGAIAALMATIKSFSSKCPQSRFAFSPACVLSAMK